MLAWTGLRETRSKKRQRIAWHYEDARGFRRQSLGDVRSYRRAGEGSQLVNEDNREITIACQTIDHRVSMLASNGAPLSAA
jgi:hypothetical protein